jgi:hypothetical protein
MIDLAYLKALVKAFRDLHGCGAKHFETVPVVEYWKGKVAWEGEVEVFELSGHSKASRGYVLGSLRHGVLEYWRRFSGGF